MQKDRLQAVYTSFDVGYGTPARDSIPSYYSRVLKEQFMNVAERTALRMMIQEAVKLLQRAEKLLGGGSEEKVRIAPPVPSEPVDS